MDKEALIKLISQKTVTKEDLLLIRQYYRSSGYKTDWFGSTGIDGVYSVYQYIFNYNAPGQKVYIFKSEDLI